MKKTTRNYLWILLANVLLIGFVAVIWQTRLKAGELNETVKQTAPGPIAPVQNGTFKFFKIETSPKRLEKASYLANLEKEVIVPDNLKGRWTILNLWATWCPPCVTELPSLQMAAVAYEPQGLNVLAISVDNAESVEDLREKIARAGITKIGVAQNWDHKGEISNVMWPESLPMTFIINPDGYVMATLSGEADWMSEDAQKFIESIIGK